MRDADVLEVGHGVIGGSEVGKRFGGGDGEHGHVGAAGGFDADVCIFDDHAIVGGDSEPFCGEKKDRGVGFAMQDVVTRNDDTEKFPQVHEVEQQVEVGAFGGGADGGGNLRGVE